MTLRNIIDNFEEIIGVTLTIVMCLAVTLGIVSRVMGAPLAWTAEVARYVFIWAVMMGAVVATKRNGHIIIEVFIELFPANMQKILKSVGNALLVAMLLLLVYNGSILTMEFWNVRMSLLPYTIGLVYASLPVCSLLMILRMIQNFYRERYGQTPATPASEEAAS